MAPSVKLPQKRRMNRGFLEGFFMAVACFLGPESSPFEKLLFLHEASGVGGVAGRGQAAAGRRILSWGESMGSLNFTRNWGFGVRGKCRGVGEGTGPAERVDGGADWRASWFDGLTTNLWLGGGEPMGEGEPMAGGAVGCEAPACAGISSCGPVGPHHNRRK